MYVLQGAWGLLSGCQAAKRLGPLGQLLGLLGVLGRLLWRSWSLLSHSWLVLNGSCDFLMLFSSILNWFCSILERIWSIWARFLVDVGANMGSKIDQNLIKFDFNISLNKKPKTLIFTVFERPQPLQDELEIDQKSIKSWSKIDQKIDHKSDWFYDRFLIDFWSIFDDLLTDVWSLLIDFWMIFDWCFWSIFEWILIDVSLFWFILSTALQSSETRHRAFRSEDSIGKRWTVTCSGSLLASAGCVLVPDVHLPISHSAGLGGCAKRKQLCLILALSLHYRSFIRCGCRFGSILIPKNL